MALIPEMDSTVRRIFAAYQNDSPRSHLGASIIGNECERALWYQFRWAWPEQFAGRMLRLFERGRREEETFVANLRAAGVTVHDVDEDGKQFTFRDAANGHFGGSMDACVRGLVEAPKTWHVAEFKTHSSKSFATLQKEGVKKAKPEHWAQMQCYMGWSGMTRAFYLAVNKDTDDLHGERIEFEREAFETIIKKAERIVNATQPPERLSQDSTFFKCRFCACAEVCHDGRIAKLNCRTCVHATPIEEGKWVCEATGKFLPKKAQLAGCANHVYLPGFIAAEAVDAGEDYVFYFLDGKRFANCAVGGFPAIDSGEVPQILTSHAMEGKTLGEIIK
jgi:hypothetical protein